MNPIKELRELTTEELINQRRDLKHEVLNLRVQQQSGQLENTALLRNNRRRVSKIETIMTERRRKAEMEAAAKPAEAAPSE
tara:strand:- start:16803 stop:17045 length:243 start_codon:yes stop_codon:yes gene_type:complete